MGAHHEAALPLVNMMGRAGSELHVISVTPTGGGTTESTDETLAGLTDTATVQVHNVTASSVAEGLVSTAAENGGLLVIGATRTRELRQWIFGGTPDRVIDLAAGAGVPVIVYAGESGIRRRIGDRLFPLYRYYRQLRSQRRPPSDEGIVDQ